MTKKLNCWEFINCGREKNGIMVPLLGECETATNMKYDGLNGGNAAGRACWMSQKSNCVVQKPGQIACCYDCAFYKRVLFEEEDKINHQLEPVKI